MSDLSELLALVPTQDIADRLGVDTATAQQGIEAALPTLLAGLEANAQDPAGAASLASALATKDGSLVEGGVRLDDVDTADGEKIVTNVFGGSADQVIAALGGATGKGSGLIQQLLPILAPIVLSWLANKFLGGGAQGGAAAEQSGGGLGGGLGDLLGGILGGTSGGGAAAGGAGGGLGDLLGGILGGGSGSGAGGGALGGGLGDLLGGLLGGGRR